MFSLSKQIPTPTEPEVRSRVGGDAARPEFAIVTGDSDGLGNAAARWLLRRSRTVQVIGLSRRANCDVQGWAELSEDERNRYHRIRADFRSNDGTRETIRQAVERIRSEHGILRAVLLVSGTGFLDTEVREDPTITPLMEQLNVAAPLAIVAELQRATDVFTPATRLFYYSGVVTHPSVTDPLLRTHAGLKKRAVAELTRQRPALTIVMPGAYRTPMFLNAVRRPDALLEWYAVPVADPYAAGGISDHISRLALRQRGNVPARVIRPRVTRLLVGLFDADGLLRTLPGAIIRCGRTVLAQTGQTDEEHDARVAGFERAGLYGPDFPYRSIYSSRLWSASRSRAYATALSGARLTR